MTAPDFTDAGAAADRALEAATVAHDVALVVALALSTEAGALTINGQEAVRTVAGMMVDAAREARNAIDRAGGMFRAARASR